MTPKRLAPITWGPPALFFVLALGFTAMTGQFSQAARAVPRLIGITMLVLCGLDLLSRLGTPTGRLIARWLNPAGLEEGPPTPDARLARRQTAATVAVIAFVATLVICGILPAVALFTLLAPRFGGRLGWPRSLAIAAAMTALIWLLFAQILGLKLFPGLLFGGTW